MTDYQPISCADYSELELAIMHRQSLQLTWCEDNVLYYRVIKPLDLVTVNHEEFLIGRHNDGSELRIRLDTIRQFQSRSQTVG